MHQNYKKICVFTQKSCKIHLFVIFIEFRKSPIPIRNWSLGGLLSSKFNKKYTNLSESQKSLLREYINNISNSNSFGKFINEEITKVVNELKPLLKKVNDKVVKIKLTEAINQAKNFTTKSVVRDNQVVSLMRYYELIKELKDVTSVR